jgi:Flp pilus assembly protein TadB
VFAALFSLAAFGWAALLAAALLARRASSRLAERLGGERPAPRPSFLEALWGAEGPFLDAARKRSALAAAAGGFFGLALGGPAGLAVFACLAWALYPRIAAWAATLRARRDFEREFPRAVAVAASGVRAGLTLRDALAQASKAVRGRCAELLAEAVAAFDRAAVGRRSGDAATLARTVAEIAEREGLPDLHVLAEASRLVTELGGGEGAGRAMEAVADGVRFRERYRQLASAATTQIRFGALLGCLMIVGAAALLSLDPQGEFRSFFSSPEGRAALAGGLLSLGAGWGVVWWMTRADF